MLSALRKHLGAITIVVAVLAGGTYAYQVQQEGQRADCQAALNQEFEQALTARSAASTARQSAQDNLLNAVSALVLHPANPKDPNAIAAARKAYTDAFQAYTDAVAQTAQTQHDNPYPTFKTCD